jgi:hypothetical protein
MPKFSIAKSNLFNVELHKISSGDESALNQGKFILTLGPSIVTPASAGMTVFASPAAEHFFQKDVLNPVQPAR